MSRGPHPDFDPYKALQLDPGAEPEIVQLVYRRLARKYHPDVTPGVAAAAKMIELNAAIDILGDPDRRAAYDRDRARRERSVAFGRASETTAAAEPRSATATRAAGSDTPGARGGAPADAPPGAPPAPRPQTVSGDWTSGRSTVGSGYDPARMRSPDGEGAAGPPPGDPSGSVLNFGRYAGWSLGEIARIDLEYLEWLDRMTIGRIYRPELDAILRAAGRRRGATVEEDRRGLFRRS